MKRWLSLAMLVFILDQISKYMIERSFDYGQRFPVLPFFDLTLWYNQGAAFSLLANASGWQRLFFITFGLTASVFIVVLLYRHASKTLFCVALALILGGALGNVLDRIVHGHVIDFLLLHYGKFYWPAFNLADAAIVGGASLMILDEILRTKAKKHGSHEHG